jgi:hypothetical protein
MDRDALLQRYREGPDQLEAAVRGLSDAELDYQPRDGGWSPREVVHHTAARETSMSILELLAADDWTRSGTHGESGPYSVGAWLEIYAAHCHDHADQIARAVKESRQGGPATATPAG